jgi:hypothetical protein
MRRGLHDLSQPLTALECCLFLGLMELSQTAEQDQLRLLRTTTEDALVQCRRVMDCVLALQERLAFADEAAG